jgi:hypothetical protein
MRAALAIALFSLAACGTARDATDAEPLNATICELSATPAKFDGRRVNVTANVDSDGIEHTSLSDSHCPGVGVAPDTPAAIRGNADMKALDAAIFKGRPGTIDKRISASFRGVFHWHPREIPMRVLTLESVNDLHVELNQEKDH